LGDGTMISRNYPVDIYSHWLASGVSAISAGGYHTCALTASGGVKCWGYNFSGQLGNGANADGGPVDVSGLSSGVSAISVGMWHTCALTTSGGVKCWGDNWAGELGNGTNSNSNVPVPVSGLSSGVSAISAGWFHTCALTTSGGVKCWGDNTSGGLGDGTTVNSNIPVNVSGLSSGVSAVSTGGYNHTCALTTSGGVKCWGDSYFAELGSKVPLDVSGLTSGISAISIGFSTDCVLTTTGGLKCWGWNNYGQLGDGTTANGNVPVPVSGFVP